MEVGGTWASEVLSLLHSPPPHMRAIRQTGHRPRSGPPLWSAPRDWLWGRVLSQVGRGLVPPARLHGLAPASTSPEIPQRSFKKRKEKTTSLFLFLKSSSLKENHPHPTWQGQPHRAPPTAEKRPDPARLSSDHPTPSMHTAGAGHRRERKTALSSGRPLVNAKSKSVTCSPGLVLS